MQNMATSHISKYAASASGDVIGDVSTIPDYQTKQAGVADSNTIRAQHAWMECCVLELCYIPYIRKHSDKADHMPYICWI